MASLGHKRLIEKKKLRKQGHWELFEERGASHRGVRAPPSPLRVPGPSSRKAEARAGPSPRTCREVENG